MISSNALQHPFDGGGVFSVDHDRFGSAGYQPRADHFRHPHTGEPHGIVDDFADDHVHHARGSIRLDGEINALTNTRGDLSPRLARPESAPELKKFVSVPPWRQGPCLGEHFYRFARPLDDGCASW